MREEIELILDYEDFRVYRINDKFVYIPLTEDGFSEEFFCTPVLKVYRSEDVEKYDSIDYVDEAGVGVDYCISGEQITDDDCIMWFFN